MSSDSLFYENVEDFVNESEGDHAIKKILIANNGIGAIKAIRSIRKWAFETFGNERAIQFVVMATPEDMRANTEYIRAADEVVDVPGGTNNNNYANVTLICEIAERLCVDAVMPMWGHASENPTLPQTLAKLSRRITFIGPPAEPMQALGDKIGSTIIAQSAKVPVISWNGDDIFVNYQATGIPPSVYDNANVKTPEYALECANRIGYPVMIKASEGGGGKGIRKVLRAEDVVTLYKQVQSEVPGSPIFIMKMASGARHLEVQLLCDKYGEAIALSGRDCSVQRRHQKIIEEGPPIAAPTNIFKRMENSACDLAKAVGYCNAGTVEYLFMEETGEYAFLELNPRLQVEHPVTENILGVNLPACQLQVAMGIPLCRIGDIRKLYGRHPRGRDTIDFKYAERKAPPRHCIAVRITAENPDSGFQPTSGKISELNFHSSIDVWGYFSVDHSGNIHEFADSQFGHIFAGGADRESARRSMIVALKELKIRGDIRNTVQYIIKMLQSQDFVENNINTAWLDERIANYQKLSAEEDLKYAPSPILVATAGAVLKSFKNFESRRIHFLNMLKVGQIPSKDKLANTEIFDLILNNIKYSFKCTQNGSNNVIIECNGSQQEVKIRTMADEGFLVNINGKSSMVYATEETGGNLRMIIDGHSCMFTPEYDPTKLRSAVAGKLARLLVVEGGHVNTGDAYAEIEVMKMYMPLKVMESGIIKYQMSEGATLSPGDIIAHIALDNPDKVVRAETFKGSLTAINDKSASSNSYSAASTEFTNETDAEVSSINNQKPHLLQRFAQQKLERVLEGYSVSEPEIEEALSTFVACFFDKSLPALEMEEAMSVLRGRIDSNLAAKILDTNTQYLDTITRSNGLNIYPNYPSDIMLLSIYDYIQSLTPDKRPGFINQISGVWKIAEKYLFLPEIRILAALQRLIESYLEVEKVFDSMSFTDVVNDLRKEYIDNLDIVYSKCRSHVNLKEKNHLMILILDEMKRHNISKMIQERPRIIPGISIRNDINIRLIKARLSELTKLRQPTYSKVSFSASILSIEQHSMSVEARRQKLNDAIISALTTGEPIGQEERVSVMVKFVESNVVIRELLLDFLRHDSDYQIAAMELYLRKTYHKTHEIHNESSGNCLGPDDNVPWITFQFRSTNQDIIKSHINMIRNRSQSYNEEIEKSIVSGDRFGVICKVDSIKDLPKHLPSIIRKLPMRSNFKPSSVANLKEFRNVIHIVVLDSWEYDDSDDSDALKLEEYLLSVRSELEAYCVRRISFFSGKPVKRHFGLEGGIEQNRIVRSPNLQAAAIQPTIYTFRYTPSSQDSVGGDSSSTNSDSDNGTRTYREDKLFRHIEAPNAFHLDLNRLLNFSVTLVKSAPSAYGNVHLYQAVPNEGTDKSKRYFARMLSLTADILGSDIESLLVEGIDQLGIIVGQEEAVHKKEYRTFVTSGNQMFLNIIVPDIVTQVEELEGTIRRLWDKYGMRMSRLAVFTVEIRLNCRLSVDSEPVAIMYVASNPTGYVLNIDTYLETMSGGKAYFKSIGDTSGPWDGLETNTPYEVTSKFDLKRFEAMASSDTLYAYDWPVLFESAIEKEWTDFYASSEDRDKRSGGNSPSRTTGASSYSPTNSKSLLRSKRPPNGFFSYQELSVFDAQTNVQLTSWDAKNSSNYKLAPVVREPGLNSCGIVVWKFRVKTPEFPNGRELIVISNDITHQNGSFGTKEDMIFYLASEYARNNGIPRIFLAANSGARIGIAQSLKSLFKICWLEEADPSKGFKYIYLDKKDYDKLLSSHNNSVNDLPVICSEINDSASGEVRYMITDIIGDEPDLGVENLMGSGLIAGETSSAYDEIFTLTLVVGRTVGIGAYLVRLGQRTIQKTRNSPIILTGYQALNKLMGQEIYSSNDQLGGPMIMFPNGVSHLLAETHMELVQKAINWLSFVPASRRGAIPIRNCTDPCDRDVVCAPTKGTYDPRILLSGERLGDKTWRSGFFDYNSFKEFLGGWAKTVVVGRARLGGIPIGVIVTENRTSEATKPADPADITSQEKMVQQAGGVWFPDSAYKTAQALRDFNREDLPCIIFANWRGFSGGQRDMFDEVLKFGSMIVDALVAYQQPLFVYIPPFAELRGGAWVVVDSTINSDVMEFYAAEEARGGVLEAAGVVSIKYRDRDILGTCHRVDHVLIALDKELAALKASKTSATSESLNKEIFDTEKKIKQREKILFGVYQQIAVHFADLHDTPGRMQAKGVIRKQVDWARSRAFFYWRLSRRLAEFDIVKRIHAVSAYQPALDKGYRKRYVSKLQDWISETAADSTVLEDDQRCVQWIKENPSLIDDFVKKETNALLKQALTASMNSLLDTSNDPQLFAEAIGSLSPSRAEQLINLIKASTGSTN